MARIRTIKPELARHEGLFELERASGFPIRLAWALLPTICDREGRFKWRPRAMKYDILPYDELDFAALLDVLRAAGLLVKYRVGDDWYGVIPTFTKHQHVNSRELDSVLPGPDAADETMTRAARVEDASADRNSPARGEGKGREGKGTGREQEGKGEGASCGRTPARAGAPLHVSHKRHAACGRICVPAELHGDFVRRRNHPDADSELRDWYLATDRQWCDDPVLAETEPGDAFAFWKARYAERWPTTPAAPALEHPRSRTVGNAAALRRFVTGGTS